MRGVEYISDFQVLKTWRWEEWGVNVSVKGTRGIFVVMNMFSILTISVAMRILFCMTLPRGNMGKKAHAISQNYFLELHVNLELFQNNNLKRKD